MGQNLISHNTPISLFEKNIWKVPIGVPHINEGQVTGAIAPGPENARKKKYGRW
jgi:hypothetical protein